MKDTKDTGQMHPSLARLYDLAVRAFQIKRTPIELARLLQESGQTINNWAKGRGVSKQGALKAQEMYGWSASWIREGIEPRLVGADDWPPEDGMPYAGLQNKRVTVTGEIKTDATGELLIEYPDASIREQVITVLGGAGVPSHGLTISTDALQPRYRAGEILIVADDLEPETGSDAVVTLKSGRVFIKQMIGRRLGMVMLHGLGGEDRLQMTLRETDIEKLRAVLSHCGVQVVRGTVKES